MGIAVGIDLGTTYSAIAWVNKHGVPEILTNAEGDRITPSVLLFEGEEVVVGTYAEQSAVVYPERIVTFIKRHIGDRDFIFFHEDKEYTPIDLSAKILEKLKHDAEEQIGESVEHAVITVPAYFNDFQRRATMKAGEAAGLNVLKLINEPTAAAFAYGMKNLGGRKSILVFDLGGGTFDVTLIEVDGTDIKAIATDGDHQLGGKDFDDILVQAAAKAFEDKHGINPLDDLVAYNDLREKCVSAKRSLSQRPRANIFFDHEAKVMRYAITREQFEEMSAPLIARCMLVTQGVLKAANYKPDQVDTVLLAGGSTRMPMVRNALFGLFGKEPATDINPDEAIALGAALTAALEYAEQSGTEQSLDIRTHDVTSHSLGMVTYREGQLHNSIIIKKNARIPTERTRDDFSTTHDGQTTLDLWLVQGEEEDPLACTALGHFEFYGIPPRPAGESPLAVTYRYTQDGMVEVEAMDKSTGRLLPHRISNQSVSLSDVAHNRVPMQIALIMDCSGSMYGQSISEAKKAAKGFSRATLSTERREIALVAFPGGVQSQPTGDLHRLSTAIDGLTPIGSTPMHSGLNEAKTLLTENPGVQRIFLVLTDGHPDDPNSTMHLAKDIRSKGARIITVGVGQQVDQDFLSSMASSPSDFHFCSGSFELEGTFLNVATQLSRDASPTLS